MLLSNVEVIYGVQKTRKGKWIEKYMGALFWKIFNVLSNVKVPQNLVTERLMKREYVNSLNSLGDRNLFMAGMMYWVGYSQKAIYVDKKLRKGKSTYSIFKRFSLLIQAITSFSERPLIFIFQLGLLITLISLITSAYFIVNKILNAEQVSLGYSSIIASIFLSLGILVCTIGIIGLYLSRVYRQVQNRPNFIIRKVYSK
jgi:putative glycosyltransferase